MHIYKHWAIPEKTKRGGGGRRDGCGYEISSGIEEMASGISGVN